MTLQEMIHAANGDEKQAFQNITEKMIDLLVKETGKECAKMTLVPGKTKVTDSKVGGIPYLEKEADYPTNKRTGEKLFFLLQVNFSQMPQIENYPTEGILQFFIDGREDYGINWADMTNQESFRILYYETCENGLPENKIEKVMPKITEETVLPFEVPGEEFQIQFEKKLMPISSGDYAFQETAMQVWEKILPEEWKNARVWFELPVYEDLIDAFSGGNSRVGGYPGFSQFDPRKNQEEYGKYELLLQLDSEGDDVDYFLVWGDVGIANFFIDPEDLKKRDFSKVMYHWDSF